ncbi:MAG: hypothetical protein IPL78_12855 [Chloroflexi bacterium]|nr:hypothetical protein [Chloroflexota bacterium]
MTATAGEHDGRLRQYMTYWFAKEKIHRDEPFAVPQPTYTFTDRMSLRLGDETLQFVRRPATRRDRLGVSAVEWPVVVIGHPQRCGDSVCEP